MILVGDEQRVEVRGVTAAELIAVTDLNAAGNSLANITTDDLTISVSEDEADTISLQVDVVDPNPGQDGLEAQTDVVGEYGIFNVLPDGRVVYDLNEQLAEVQGLVDGETLEDTLFIRTTDATDVDTVVVTIIGAQDAGKIDAAGLSATIMEDSQFNVSGQLQVIDPDLGEAGVVERIGAIGEFGTLDLLESGAWTYELDSSDSRVQALSAGETLSDSFTVISLDQSDADEITITIVGTNDIAQIGSQGTALVVSEDETDILTSWVTVTDPDNGESALIGLRSSGSFGSFVVDANGQWQYDLDETLSAVQTLAPGETLRDTVEILSADGTATATLTVTIIGENEVAAIGPEGRAVSIVEDATEAVGASLSITDNDPGQAEFVAQEQAAGIFGTFSISSDGTWTYRLDSDLDVVQSLAFGDTLQDSLSVSSFDGSAAAALVVTIIGSNDPSTIEISRSVGEVSEDETGLLSGFVNVADIDNGEAGLSPQQMSFGDYGTFTVNADGSWTYDLNETLSGVQELDNGETLQDSIQVAAIDGESNATLSVTIIGETDIILGTNDPDTLRGAASDDQFDGLAGDDSINGLGGNDSINGARGNDTLIGSVGNDSIQGGPGFDLLLGQAGDDTLLGGNARDTLVGGRGADILDGGDGAADQVTYVSSSAGVSLTLRGDGTAAMGHGGDAEGDLVSNVEQIVGSNFNDTIRGNSFGNRLIGLNGADIIEGLDGDDILSGGGDGDSLLGGLGDDRAFGQAGNDFVYGEDGNDLLSGGLGNDFISGGNGDDRLLGQGGDDTLAGNEGNDTLVGGGGRDLFVYDGKGSDEIIGIRITDDTLDISQIETIADLESLTEIASDVAGGLLFEFGDGNSLLLRGISLDQLPELSVDFTT